MEVEAASAGRKALLICEGLGFACAGICAASPSRWGAELRSWLAAGKHGSMEYLERNVEARLDPGRVLPGAKSVVMVADQYAERGSAEEGREREGRIAKYARGKDYHEVIKSRLHELSDQLRAAFAGHEFRTFVDTAPVLEREHAAAAGLGWIGKHTLLIHPRRGSYLLLGGVLTTLEMSGTPDVVADHCGTCTRCIDACPTDAISPYSVDASRCIAYLTIERRGAVPVEFHSAIGDWLFGCDICQDVCPHNSPREAPVGTVRSEYGAVRTGFDVLEVLGWTEEDRRAGFRGSPLKRATLAMMKRNAVIVAGNLYHQTRDRAVLDRIGEVAGDVAEPEMVRRTAEEVVSRARGRGGAV